MLRSSNFLILLLVLIVLSCTIIKDSDVTSADQASQLTLKSFSIEQSILSGDFSATATLKYDSVVSTKGQLTNEHLSKRKAFSMSPVGNHKLKMKCKVRDSATVVLVDFRDNGTPDALYIKVADSILEAHTYFYNTSKQVIKVITRINPIDNKKPTVYTEDVLTYESTGVLKTFARTNKYTNAVSSFSAFQTNSSGSNVFLNSWGWSSLIYNLNPSSCNSNSNDPTICGNLYVTGSAFGNNSNPNIDLQNLTTLGKTAQTVMVDERFRNGNQCDCTRQLDTYYFHPTMLLRDAFLQGGMMSEIYSIDWWIFSAAQVNGQNLSKSDQVTLKLNYAK